MRLIDADALADDLLYDVELCERALDDTDIVGKERERLQWEKDCKQNCVYYLTETPPIDAVSVVRCRDCKYSATEGLNVTAKCGDLGKRHIRFCKYDLPTILTVADTHFCSCGERKDDV